MAQTDVSKNGFWVVGGKTIPVRSVTSPTIGVGGQVNQGYSIVLGRGGSLRTSAKLNFSKPSPKSPNTRSRIGGGGIVQRTKLKPGARQRGQLRGQPAGKGSSVLHARTRTII